MYSTLIRKHIWQRKDDEMFCNRDFLKFAKRALIDKVLSALTKTGDLIRIARGVYMKQSSKFSCPSNAQIARFKAESFGRRIVAHKADAAKSLGLCTKEANQISYLTDGYSSSFLTASGTRIYFQRSAARIVRLTDDVIGTAIKALWYCGQPLSAQSVMTVVSQMYKSERLSLKDNAAWMPAWMADTFIRLV